MQQSIDISSPNDWANLLIGLLDKGEWKTLLFTLILAFSITYTLKIIYFILVPAKDGHPNHIRLIAIIAGFIASALAWNGNAISMEWYAAGLMVGPLSIALHHALYGISRMPIVIKRVPWLQDIVKGAKRK